MISDSSSSSSASGYILDSFEGVDSVFTEVTELSRSSVNIILKAKRYGRWWLLKGLEESVREKEAYRQMLRKEFDILSLLQHPSIVMASALETIDGHGYCIVMEYIDGQTLYEWLKSNPTKDERRHMAMQIIKAVEYIHSKSIVHRDLKPSNIMVTHNGENAKIIDFGLADTDSHAILKQPGGTMKYMAPEQALVNRADVRNDIYSLGVIFKEMQLGWKSIVRRCLLPADRRFQNTNELLQAINSKSRRKKLVNRILMTAGIIIALTISVALALRKNPHNYSDTSLSDSDSLRKSLNAQIASNEQLKKELELQKNIQDNLQSSLDSVNVNLIERLSHDERVKALTDKGLKLVHRIFDTWPTKIHLDTLSDARYFDPTYSIKSDYVTKVEEFLNSECLDFNETEKSNLRVMLDVAFSELQAPYITEYLKYKNGTFNIEKTTK